LRISPATISDAEVASLFAALDGDRSGSVSVHDVCGFLDDGVDVAALEAQVGTAQAALQTLQSAQEQLILNLRCKTAAWRIDESCKEVTPVKGLSLDQAPYRPRLNTAKLIDIRRRKLELDREVISKLRQQIKSASYNTFGRDLSATFMKFDKDNSGELTPDEVRTALRRHLRIPKSIITDENIVALCSMLDADCSGTVNLSELVAFVGPEPEISQRTGHTLSQGASRTPTPPQPNAEGVSITDVRSPRGPRPASCSPNLAGGRKRLVHVPSLRLTPEVIDKVRQKIKAAAYTSIQSGTDLEAVLGRFVKDGSGMLEVDEVRLAMRKLLRIPKSVISDDEIVTFCSMLDTGNSGRVGVRAITDLLSDS